MLLHEICHAMRRADALPLLVSTDATDRNDVAAIPGLGLLLAEGGCAGVRLLVADGTIAGAALPDGDLRAIRAAPAPSNLAISSWGPHLPLMTAIAHIDPEDGFVLSPGPLESPSAHARAAQAARADFPAPHGQGAPVRPPADPAGLPAERHRPTDLVPARALPSDILKRTYRLDIGDHQP